jgi:hypothetical protein
MMGGDASQFHAGALMHCCWVYHLCVNSLEVPYYFVPYSFEGHSHLFCVVIFIGAEAVLNWLKTMIHKSVLLNVSHVYFNMPVKGL